MSGIFRGKEKRIIAAGLLLIMGSVAGCGASSAENKVEISEFTQQVTKSQVLDFDYEVPVQIPWIYVDQIGYNIDSEKVAVICGETLPEYYEIRRLDDDEVVYTGEVTRPVTDESTGKIYAAMRFSELKEEGNYYIYADTVGASYSFTIGEDVYRDAFDKACKNYYINRCGIAISQIVAGDNGHSACHTAIAHLQDGGTEIDVTGGWHMDERADKDSLMGSKIVENLVLAFEMNQSAFTDEVGIPESGNEIPDILDEAAYEAEWLLKMQDAKTGGVYGACVTQSADSSDIFSAPVRVTGISMDATINFAATMARFSFFYQQYDSEFATTALKAADRAWECFLNNHNYSDNSACFKAAAELYRATGALKYSEVIERFFASDGFMDDFYSDENIFMGSVTYLSTSQNVDKEQCDKLIKALMKRSEEIAKRAGNSRFFVASIPENGDFSELLEDMRCLTITNHIIYNHEYTTIIENHLHFLAGMNQTAMNYVTDSTEMNYSDDANVSGIINNPQYDALLIFMMSVLEQA